MKACENPRPIAPQASHNAVIDRLDDEKRGRILDIPCGRGALSIRLIRMGFDVHCCDIDPALFELPEKEPAVANLNCDTLPYPDGYFDYIVSINGLHRIHNLGHAISEFARCLALDGKLFISLPNYCSIWRRLMFLVYGSLGRGIDEPTFTQVTNDSEAHFRFPLTVARVVNELDNAGLGQVTTFNSGVESWNWFGFPLAVAVSAVTRLWPAKLRRAYQLRLGNGRDVILGSHNIFLCACPNGNSSHGGSADS